MSAADAIVPRAVPWWAVAWGVLTGAFVIVLLWIVAAYSGADWFDAGAPIVVPGSSFQVARGTGHRERSSIVLEATSGGIAAVSAAVVPFPAARYPRVEWLLRSPRSPGEIAFAWRTREQPDRLFTKPLQWLNDAAAPLNMGDEETWRGTITGVGLVMRGSLRAPLEISSVKLPSASAGATLSETFAQWVAFYPLKGYAVAFPFDAERADYLPLVQAVAAAVVLAMAAYLLLVRRGRVGFDGRVLWAIFAGAWLLLDLRWQVNVGRQLARTAERFAGKTAEEKALAAEDASLYEVAREIGRVLPTPPARVVLLCDSNILALRIAYFLYPHNVYRDAGFKRDGDRNPLPDPAALRKGDHVVIFYFDGLAYDAQKQELRWPDGRALPAEALLAKPELVVLRLR
jgi:hypothetical protein